MGKDGRVLKVREKDIQRLILDWLDAEKIWNMRLNTGAMFGTHKGKSWAVRFAKPGCADILAMPQSWVGEGGGVESPLPTWIEVKGSDGRQSDDQKRFQAEVEKAGMRYILAKSLEDVKAQLSA